MYIESIQGESEHLSFSAKIVSAHTAREQYAQYGGNSGTLQTHPEVRNQDIIEDYVTDSPGQCS